MVGGRDLWGRPSRPIVKPEFAGILKDFQMSLMSQRFRTQRQVYRYCKEYFEALAYPELKKNASWWWMSMNDDELLVFLTELFVAADDDNSGALDEAEFTNVMASLGLSLNQMKLIWREADADGSGAVDYEEFLPVMVKLLKVMIQMQQTKDEVARIRAQAATKAEEYMVRSISSAELEQLMREAFQRADADGSGSLDLDEFQMVLMESEANLTRKEIKMLFLSIDEDESGKVDFEEFLPVFHAVMRKTREDQTAKELLGQIVHALPDMLVKECAAFAVHHRDILLMPAVDQVDDAALQLDIHDLELGGGEGGGDAGEGAGGVSGVEEQAVAQRYGEGEAKRRLDEALAEQAELLAEHKKLAEANEKDDMVAYASDTGFITLRNLCRAIRQADLGLTNLQIYSVVASVELYDKGTFTHASHPRFINISKFVHEHAAPSIAKILQVFACMRACSRNGVDVCGLDACTSTSRMLLRMRATLTRKCGPKCRTSIHKRRCVRRRRSSRTQSTR